MFAREKPVRNFLIAQLVCTFLIASLTSIFWGRLGFISVLVGGAVAAMNAVGTAFAWPRLLEKKDVALALSIIVSKFALSIGIFYWLTLEPNGDSLVGRTLNGMWFGDRTIVLGSAPGTLVAFALGLCSVVPAALVVAVKDLTEKDLKKD